MEKERTSEENTLRQKRSQQIHLLIKIVGLDRKHDLEGKVLDKIVHLEEKEIKLKEKVNLFYQIQLTKQFIFTHFL